MGGGPEYRPGRFEVLGAWLHVWTPPRDAVIPPVPWRAVAAGAVLVIAAIVAIVAFALPRLAQDRAAANRRDEAAAARRHAAFLATVAREQTPRRGHGRPDPGAGAAAQRRTQARGALLASAQSGIERDARGRTSKHVQGVACEPFPRTLGRAPPVADLARPAAAYDCVAVTARFGSRSAPGGQGVIGMPFRLVVHFDRGRFAWCRVVPLDDKDRLTHPLPPACRLAPG